MAYDLLIKGGTVIDPSQELNAVRDVALSGGKVSAVREGIPERDAADVVDAAGLIVVPGLLDLHVHVYWGVTELGIEPDPTSLARGVTTALDAGSSGARTFGAFRKYVLEPAETRLFALLNISGMGQIANNVGELEDLRWANVEEAVIAGARNRDFVLGIKARLSRNVAGDNDADALKRALEAAEALGGFVMIHVGDTRTPLEELVAMLRPGDVVTHTFHGRGNGVLDDSGRVLEAIKEAQRRGVVFDIGHGAGSFAFEVAEKALSDGFFPGNISSDLHALNVDGPVYDHVTVLSKFVHLGMPLYDVVKLSTVSTARAMGLDEKLGTLKEGSEGDVSILREDEGDFTLTDAMGASVQARRKLSHVLTVKGGHVYRPWIGEARGSPPRRFDRPGWR